MSPHSGYRAFICLSPSVTAQLRGLVYIEPGSPWENPFIESFNARLRDELFNREIFSSVFEAKVLYNDWCEVYNNFRPHSSIGSMAPAAFGAMLFGQPPPGPAAW